MKNDSGYGYTFTPFINKFKNEFNKNMNTYSLFTIYLSCLCRLT